MEARSNEESEIIIGRCRTIFRRETSAALDRFLIGLLIIAVLGYAAISVAWVADAFR